MLSAPQFPHPSEGETPATRNPQLGEEAPCSLPGQSRVCTCVPPALSPRQPHWPHSWTAACQRRLHAPVGRERQPLSSRGTLPGCGRLPGTPSTGSRGKGERRGHHRAACQGGSPAGTPRPREHSHHLAPLQAVTRAFCMQVLDTRLAASHPGDKATASPPDPGLMVAGWLAGGEAGDCTEPSTPHRQPPFGANPVLEGPGLLL